MRKHITSETPRWSKTVKRHGRSGRFVVSEVRRGAPIKSVIDEKIEDARLNAIADERAEGPFIKVSLNDL